MGIVDAALGGEVAEREDLSVVRDRFLPDRVRVPDVGVDDLFPLGGHCLAVRAIVKSINQSKLSASEMKPPSQDQAKHKHHPNYTSRPIRDKTSCALTRIGPYHDVSPHGVLHAPQALGHRVLVPRPIRLLLNLRRRPDALVVMLRGLRVRPGRVGIDLRRADEPLLELREGDVAIQSRLQSLLPRLGVDVRLANVLEEEADFLPVDLAVRVGVEELL